MTHRALLPRESKSYYSNHLGLSPVVILPWRNDWLERLWLLHSRCRNPK